MKELSNSDTRSGILELNKWLNSDEKGSFCFQLPGRDQVFIRRSEWVTMEIYIGGEYKNDPNLTAILTFRKECNLRLVIGSILIGLKIDNRIIQMWFEQIVETRGCFQTKPMKNRELNITMLD